MLPCYGRRTVTAAGSSRCYPGGGASTGLWDKGNFGAKQPVFNWDELASAGGNMSLFAESQIIELRLSTGKPGAKGSAAIVKYAEKLREDILFLVSAPKLNRNTASAKWVKALEKHGGMVQVWPIGKRDLPGWIENRMKYAGLDPDFEAVQLIADRVEGNLLAAQQEIEKVASTSRCRSS